MFSHLRDPNLEVVVVVAVVVAVVVVVVAVSFISAPSAQYKNTIRVMKYNAAQEKGRGNKTINVMACR